MRAKKHSRKSTVAFPILISLFFSLILLNLVTIKKQQVEKPASLGVETSSLYCKGSGHSVYVAKGQSETIKANLQIYNMLGSISSGGVVIVGTMIIGTGDVSVSDSRNNEYRLLIKQPSVNNPEASTYLFASNITNDLPIGSVITITAIKAKTLSSAIMGCKSAANLSVVETGGRSGYSNLPISPALNVLAGDVVVGMAGINAKSTNFGLGYVSGNPMSANTLECQTAGASAGSNVNSVTTDLCFSVASATGTFTMQQNIVDTKKYLDPTAAPKVDWTYVMATIR